MYLLMLNFPYGDICIAEWCVSEKCITLITWLFKLNFLIVLCEDVGRKFTNEM